MGEYQAGGTILVLGIGCGDSPPIGAFCGTGMHGGVIYIRSAKPPSCLPKQVKVQEASPEDMRTIFPLMHTYCKHFGFQEKTLKDSSFWRLSPDDQNPYHRLYTPN